MTQPPLRFVLKDTTDDEIIVTWVVDDERRKDSRCYIEFVQRGIPGPTIAMDMALNPDMLEKLTDHLTAVWQVLDKTPEAADDD